MKQPENKGLLFEEIVEKDGVFGSSHSFAGKTIIAADGQWEVVVDHERQSSDFFDSFSCVSFGLNNQEEHYLAKRYGITINHSDRFLAKVSDTQPNGATPQKVYEARRKKGFLFEIEWSWGDAKAWTEYMKAIPQNLLTLAIGNAAEWSFWHDYVPTDTASLKEALRYSPVCVGVALMPIDSSRPQEEWVYYRPDNWQDTHWAMLKGYYPNGDWKLYDTYFPFEKRIRAGYDFRVAKVIEVEKNVVVESFWTKFITGLRALLGYD